MKKKKLNELEMDEVLRGNHLIQLDDLQFDAIAKNKLLQQKQVETSENIDQMEDLEIRQIVVKDYIRNLEKIENNFDERDARIEAGDNFEYYQQQDSIEISSYDSHASRVNFWKDIN